MFDSLGVSLPNSVCDNNIFVDLLYLSLPMSFSSNGTSSLCNMLEDEVVVQVPLSVCVTYQ